jgi:hypothetical protein
VFKWACLLVAVVFLGFLGWVLNDMRLSVRQASDTIQETGRMANKHLPGLLDNASKISNTMQEDLPRIRLSVRRASETIQETGKMTNKRLPGILDNASKISDTMQEDLPGILERARTATDNLAEVSADVRTLKDALAQMKAKRDPALLEYAASVLAFTEAARGATIGSRPLTGVGGVRNAVPAKVWAASARRNVPLLTLVTKSKPDLLNRLTRTALGTPWLIQLADRRRMNLLEWLKENHPETKALFNE